jgi:hypothetical protein
MDAESSLWNIVLNIKLYDCQCPQVNNCMKISSSSQNQRYTFENTLLVQYICNGKPLINFSAFAVAPFPVFVPISAYPTALSLLFPSSLSPLCQSSLSNYCSKHSITGDQWKISAMLVTTSFQCLSWGLYLLSEHANITNNYTVAFIFTEDVKTCRQVTHWHVDTIWWLMTSDS